MFYAKTFAKMLQNICKTFLRLGSVVNKATEFVLKTRIIVTVLICCCCFSEGWLSHAILDVFEKEPLPVDSDLWIHPNVTITPHVAGLDVNCKKVNRSMLCALIH